MARDWHGDNGVGGGNGVRVGLVNAPGVARHGSVASSEPGQPAWVRRQGGGDDPLAMVAHDARSPRNEYAFEAPAVLVKALAPMLADKRDEVMLHLLLNICLVTVSSALALYFLLPASHVLGAAHLSATLGLFLQRFILWLHYSEHRRTFTGKGYLPRVLNMLPSMALCALFGIPPGMYRLHHIVMHHAENNMFPYDVSSTEPYQRDSFAQFLLYWVRYWAALWVELPCYALRRKRYAYFFQSSLCISGYAVGVSWLYRRHPTQTLWVFMLPFVAASLAMMFGNWSQHIFIDGKRPRNNYALTYNCINAADNLRSFNDGYHVVHHVNSKLHWSELPAKFVDTLDKHAEEGALVFEGVGFFDVGFLVFTRQLDKLAARIVQLGHRKRTHEELVRLLEERLKPVAQSR